jgi:UDP-4-amino-4,6-dideoxy-N-acetyl-beta-L-altrosamine transaminase
MEGIDTNILIYAFDKSSRFHHQAFEFIQDKIQSTQLAIAEFSLFEFYGVITDGRKIGIPMAPAEAWSVIHDFYESQHFVILPCSSAWWRETLKNANHFGVKRNDIYDFLIASTFQENNTPRLYTLNTRDFKNFDFIQAINPFDKSRHTLKNNVQTESSFKIPYGRQFISEQDVAAVCSVLRSDFLTQGPKVPEFEHAVANYCCAKHAVATNSATSALHIACLALGLGPGDILWTSPITFVASANCALYCGARIDFVDIDPKTYNMSIQALEAKLVDAEQAGTLPKIVIPVHFSGQPCDMEKIADLADEYGFSIIEDASHAIGARYHEEPIGCCHYSDVTVFSFHPVKIITTAEGGMAVTNIPHLAHKMQLLRNHGITRDADQMTHLPDGPWYYQQIDLGFNYRMTDIQAALGLSQLSKLAAFVERRKSLARHYDRLLADLPITRPYQHPDSSSAWHLYIIRLDLEKISLIRKNVLEYLREKGIGVNVHYIPVHTQPYYQAMGFTQGLFPEAEKYYQETLTLPLFPAMTEEQQDQVLEVLKSAIQNS